MSREKYPQVIPKNKPPEGKVFIYTLSDPITKEVRYVGKTIQSLHMRYVDHVAAISCRNHLNYYSRNWIKGLHTKGLLPIIELLDTVEARTWEEDEKFYIEYLRFLGFRLTNTQIGGGSGNLGKRWKINEEKRRKINDIHKNKDYNLRLVNTNGKQVRTFKNIREASEYFNVSYKIMHRRFYRKSLINQEFFLLSKNENFDNSLLINSRQKIKILNIDNNKEEVFTSSKQASKFINISEAKFSVCLNGAGLINNLYKISRI